MKVSALRVSVGIPRQGPNQGRKKTPAGYGLRFESQKRDQAPRHRRRKRGGLAKTGGKFVRVTYKLVNTWGKNPSFALLREAEDRGAGKISGEEKRGSLLLKPI